jgi:alkylated DNA repair protein (DNA oxidative demethylase)
MTLDLFPGLEHACHAREELCAGAVVLRGFASRTACAVIAELRIIASVAPFRHMTTPGGFRMSVAMTNCGRYGWVADRNGYRYSRTDPESGRPWPNMPSLFVSLAEEAAAAATFPNFRPDSCLINRYELRSRLSMHQDKDERDYSAPIVSVSLGLPAVFLLGGLRRDDRARRVSLFHGDVVVWGGPARLRYHGVAALKAGRHPTLGEQRINLTFRQAM